MRPIRQQWRSRFDGIALSPKPATSLGKIEAEAVYHGDHALLRWRSCQSSRPAWGKFPVELVYHGDSSRKSGDHAKTRDSRPAWEKSNGNPFIMAISPRKRRLRQNRRPSTALGKFQPNPFILAITKPFGLAKPFGLGKQGGMAPGVEPIDDKRPRILVFAVPRGQGPQSSGLQPILFGSALNQHRCPDIGCETC